MAESWRGRIDVSIQRGSDKHGARQDEQLQHELEGTLRANRPSRAEEWRDPEPPADDDPEVWSGTAPGASDTSERPAQGRPES
jgi:hypothetical protein